MELQILDYVNLVPAFKWQNTIKNNRSCYFQMEKKNKSVSILIAEREKQN